MRLSSIQLEAMKTMYLNLGVTQKALAMYYGCKSTEVSAILKEVKDSKKVNRFKTERSIPKLRQLLNLTDEDITFALNYYRHSKPIDYLTLFDLFILQERSVTEISTSLGHSQANIINYLKYYNINSSLFHTSQVTLPLDSLVGKPELVEHHKRKQPSKNKSTTLHPDTVNFITQEYCTQGRSIESISKQVGLPKSEVSNLIHELQLKTPTQQAISLMESPHLNLNHPFLASLYQLLEYKSSTEYISKMTHVKLGVLRKLIGNTEPFKTLYLKNHIKTEKYARLLAYKEDIKNDLLQMTPKERKLNTLELSAKYAVDIEDIWKVILELKN